MSLIRAAILLAAIGCGGSTTADGDAPDAAVERAAEATQDGFQDVADAATPDAPRE
jgi:hypothetical protein